MNILHRQIFGPLLLLLSTALPLTVMADNDAEAVFDPEATLFDEFVQQPPVPKKSRAYIKEFMRNEALKLAQLNYDVETMRRGEVVIVNIPTDKLFAPNDTVLMPDAGRQLANLLAYCSTPGRYKVIFKVHTDDTGSELYLYNLSVSRMNAIYDYFDSNAASPDDVFGYPEGCEEPRTLNDSRRNRSANRRLEVFILPGEGLIQQSGKH